MNTNARSELHPQPIELDRLRAGLLDDRPGDKARLLAHVAACAPCRRRIERWRTIASCLNAPPAPVLAQALRARRRSALAGHGAARPLAFARLAPRYALAAAVAALLVGTGVFLAFDRPAERVPPTAQTDVPDLYADLDFYLWLAQENAKSEIAPNRS